MRERTWEKYPALRQILETREVPARYYGRTSVSDNIFDAFQRLMRLSVLIEEFQKEIIAGSKELDENQLLDDLRLLERQLGDASSFFGDSLRQVRLLQEAIMISRRRDNQ